MKKLYQLFRTEPTTRYNAVGLIVADMLFARSMRAVGLLLVGLMFTPYHAALAAPESFAPLVKRLLPSVVNIRSEVSTEAQDDQRRPVMPQLPPQLENFFRQFNIPRDNQPPRQSLPSTSMGSGFIIDTQGLVVTNNHVVEGADNIYITMQDGDEFEASLVGTDPKTDLALLRFDHGGKTLTMVEFGDSDRSEVGDWVLAIGNPLGRLGGSVSAGIISARGRDINVGPYDDFIQTDAAINRGNSGGPLFNTDGEVIGINTIIFSPTGGSIGIGFSVPSNLAKKVVEQLNEFGTTRRGWLGVLIQDITPEIAESLGLEEPAGALVSQVTPNSPAAKSGFEVGDLITAFDGKVVESSNKLPILVAETPVGKRVDVEVIRGGDTITLTVNLGQLEKAEQLQLAAQEDNRLMTPNAQAPDYILGMVIKPIDRALREQYALDEATTGMVVTDVEPNSQAAIKGIQAGDLVLRINQITLSALDDLYDAIEQAQEKGRRNVMLYIQSEDSTRFIALPIDE